MTQRSTQEDTSERPPGDSSDRSREPDGLMGSKRGEDPSDRAATGEPRSGAPALAPVELARWTWRQLTSMRTALILLFLLALGAVPGSVIPQTAVDSVRTSRWQSQHPQLTPVYEKLGLFSVYDSVWFTAIYILLMVSLVGCIVPRLRVYWRGVRARPPQAPRHLGRMREHQAVEVDEEPEVVLERARAALRRKHYRVDVSAAGERDDGSVSAERGYLREAGNLVFHLSVLIVLVGFAIGSLWGFKGGVIVVTKDGFANTLSQYDDFRAGALFDPATLDPFDFTVDKFDVTFIREGREAGMAHEFGADLTYRATPASPAKDTRISVNHPLRVGSTDVFLLSHGYAPRITVRNTDGTVAFSGPVVFLPENSTFRSYGVVKVTDPQQRSGSTQIGLEGEFYPTYAFTAASGPFSAFPDAKNPAISMTVFTGDLGLDSGAPQSVYSLDKKGLTQLKKDNGRPELVTLGVGRSATLPDGLGTVTLDGVSRYVKLQVSHTPGQRIALAGVVLALIGLLGSLFIRPRRIWVRVRRDGRRTLVEVAGLDRSSGGDLSAEIARVSAAIQPDGTSTNASRTSRTTDSTGPDPAPRGDES